MLIVILLFLLFFFLMIRRPPRSTQSRSSAASDVYKRQHLIKMAWRKDQPISTSKHRLREQGPHLQFPAHHTAVPTFTLTNPILIVPQYRVLITGPRIRLSLPRIRPPHLSLLPRIKTHRLPGRLLAFLLIFCSRWRLLGSPQISPCRQTGLQQLALELTCELKESSLPRLSDMIPARILPVGLPWFSNDLIECESFDTDHSHLLSEPYVIRASGAGMISGGVLLAGRMSELASDLSPPGRTR
eukprot:TRINITY_DN1997_c0_g1_i2.p1 TRINITY_DN1997_c0_g1~~TRINITY_DN1997_c0_g1_i2.p1  ORF type:complete len:243 (-),score=33.28 TRINITY_DN1997_c0_g1_i2:551-1279(-)